MEHIFKERLMHMQTYPLIGIAGNHRQDLCTEEDRYILSYAPNGFVRGLEKAKSDSCHHSHQ